MEIDNFINNITPEQSNLNSKILELVVARVLKRAYFDLDENGKAAADKVFLSADGKEKNDFIKKYIPNFRKTF